MKTLHKNAPGRHDQLEHGSWAEGQTDIHSILQTALANVKPSPEEMRNLKDSSAKLKTSMENVARQMGLSCKIMQVGSSARDTWLKGDGDIDMFMVFPEGSDVNSNVQKALELAKTVCPDGTETYASHPYLSAHYGKFDVDLVPAFQTDIAKNGLMSAMDRTPYHNEFVQGKIAELNGLNRNAVSDDVTDDIRLMKSFMKANKVYGSDVKTAGFSGYSAELITLNYGSFMNALHAVADWKNDEYLAPNGNGGSKFDAPLTIIDPVDCTRNVTAALSEQKMDEFRDAARKFLDNPTLNAFDKTKTLSVKDRGLRTITVTYDYPKGVNEDNLYPQLQRSCRMFERMLNDNDFKVFNAKVSGDKDKITMNFEMTIDKLPAIKRQLGAPLEIRKACESFRAAHPDAYVHDRRLAVDIPRKYTDAKDFLASIAKEFAPKYVKNGDIQVEG